MRYRVLLCIAVLLAQLGQFNSVAEARTALPPMAPGQPRATGVNLTSVATSKIMPASNKPKRAGFAATITRRAQRYVALSTHLAQGALVGAGPERGTTFPVRDAASTLNPCGAPMARNTTWTPTSVHVLNCTFTVGPDATLTMRAGTVVKFTAGAGLSVEGTLDSTGTAAHPVVVTSVNNNSVGGATGSGKPAAGDWGKISVGGAGSVHLVYTDVSYAGYGLWGTTTGSVSVEHGRWSDFASGGISVTTGPGRVEGVTVDNSGTGPAFSVVSDQLDLGDFFANAAKGGSLPAFLLSGTVSKSSTLSAEPAAWLLNDQDCSPTSLNIPAKVTATLGVGAVLKGFGQANAGSNGCGGPVMTVEGTLDSTGTAAHPVVVTSVNNNSVGGATGSGKPAAGDWGKISVGGAGSVHLVYTDVSYAGYGLWGTTTGSVSVEHGRWSDFASGGISVTTGPGRVEGVTVDNSGTGPAFSVVSDQLDLGDFFANAAKGGSLPAFLLSGTVSKSSTLSAEPAAWLLNDQDCSPTSLNIPAKVTATLGVGAVLKGFGQANAGSNGCGGPVMTVEGTLDSTGTAAHPVVVTSVNNNSVGGATGSGKPAAGDWGKISVGGAGSVHLVYTDVSYAGYGLWGTTTGSVSVEHGRWSDFASGGISVTTGPGRVEGVTVDNSGTGPAFSVVSDQLDLGDFFANAAKGGSLPAFLLSGTVSKSSTLSAEPAAWLLNDQDCSPTSLNIPAKVTATLGVGAVLKGFGQANAGSNGCGGPVMTVEGTLDSTGTAAHPVVVTSVNNNSVGGATGSGKPAAGDWGKISVGGAGSVHLVYTDVSYAGYGLWGTTTGDVVAEADDFLSNQVAVDITATAGGTASIDDDWFAGNATSVDASSLWSPVDPECEFVPTVAASGNLFGGGSRATASHNPPVSKSDYAAIETASVVPDSEQYPDGWVGEIMAGTTDLVTGWSVELCADPLDPETSCEVVAIPLDFDGGTPTPAFCSPGEDSKLDSMIRYGADSVRSATLSRS